MSIKNALASALEVAQLRGQRDLRRQALSDSDQLRRQDLSGVFDIFQAQQGFISPGSQIAGADRISQRNVSQQNNAANLAFLGSIVSTNNLCGGTATAGG